MANLTEDMYDSIDEELKAFSYLTPKKKASTILKDFRDSKANDNKMSKAKTEIEAEFYDYHRMRLYTKAQREVGMLSDDEMGEYLRLIMREIDKDMSSASNFSKMLDKIGVYNSATFLLREHSDGNNVIKPKIKLDDENLYLLNSVVDGLNALKQKICDIDKVM